MKRFMKRKVVVVASTVALVLGIGGAAFAFFTSSGTGTGSAVVGTAATWKITSAWPTALPTLLYPDLTVGAAGGTVQKANFVVTNEGKGNQQLDEVTISVANSDGASWSVQGNLSDPACTAADFSIDGTSPGSTVVDSTVGGLYTPGQSMTGHVTVEMIDNGQNQDNCQGVTVPLFFSTTYPGVTGTDLSVLTIDGPPPTLGSGGFYPNPNYDVVPTVTSGSNVSLTVTVIQPASVSDGTIAVSFDNTLLSFTSAGDSTGCTAATSGTVTTETCTYTDLDHTDSSKPFNFTTTGSGSTTAVATVTVGADTATESFGLNIS